MRPIKLLTLPIALFCMMPLMANDNDPVLMEVGNDTVKLSEFEYLYNKNSQQQLEKESLDDYLKRFIIYKLKVEDARAAGIDTTSAFKKEFNTYKNELAEPYLQDSSVIEKLALETYERMKTEVDVEHIMLPPVPEYAMQQSVEKLDSLKQCVLNGEDFGDLAVKYSVDRSVQRNRGHLGYLTVGRTPYSFENAAYTTPVGEMTIVRSNFGVHLIKVLGTRPAQGEVLVEHILKLYPRYANDSIKAATKAVMDCIYNVVKSGADFEEVARAESEDPGSAAQGGKLPWFGTGRMVPDFERVSFELPQDSISEPFETPYGIHIVKKLGSRGLGSYADNKDVILMMINRDERAGMPRLERIKQLKQKYGLQENAQFIDLVTKEVEAYGKYDSTFVQNLKDNINCEAFAFADKKVSSQDVFKALNPDASLDKESIVGYISAVMTRLENSMIVNYEMGQLSNEYPDYRNLLNEYFDGMMLFEISNMKVWDKANRDTEGLEAFFKEHKNDYTWTEPRYKGYIIYTSNDSLETEIKKAITVIGRDSLFQTLRKQFKRNIRIERQLVKKGENPIVDELAFGCEPAEKKDNKWVAYFEFEGKIIDQPEEAGDVRGQVTADYQNELEKEWVAQLKEKYKVKINKKVLKKIRD